MLHAPIKAQRRLVPDAAPLELAVIIATRDHASDVSDLLSALESALASVTWEAIFVDDGSTDGTADILREIGRRNIRVRVLQRIGRRGPASAVIEGMLATSAPFLAVIDADGRHDERLLPRLLSVVRDGGCDLAVGSRRVPGGAVADWGEPPHLASRWVTALAQRITRTPLSDPMGGLFLTSRATLEAALPRLSATGSATLLDLVASSPAPLRIVELPAQWRDRAASEGKRDLALGIESLKLLLDKSVGRYLPMRLIQFLMAEGLGFLVHLGVLGTLIALGFLFTLAQAVAVWLAMTVSFALNNVVAYGDRRLHGWRMLGGLVSFYAVCLLGAAAHVGAGAFLHQGQQNGWAAGVAGALVGTVWNFAASGAVTWRK